VSEQVYKIKDKRPIDDVERIEGNAACTVPEELCPMDGHRYV
jgi:hypothetical protein